MFAKLFGRFKREDGDSLESLVAPVQEHGRKLQGYTRAFLLEQRARVLANMARGSASGSVTAAGVRPSQTEAT